MKYITRGREIFLFREVGLSECAFQKMPPKILENVGKFSSMSELNKENFGEQAW